MFLNNHFFAVCLLFAATAARYMIPDYMLANRRKVRKEKINRELPGILNTLAIMTDAGLSLYEALRKVSESRRGIIPLELKRVVDTTNNREIKPRNDIYLIKDNQIPSTLIECGFLSNDKEAKLLNDEEYQNQIAWAIYVGVQRYFSETN